MGLVKQLNAYGAKPALRYLLVLARVRAFFTEAQNHEERANMRYYKLNHPQSRPFLSPTGC